MKAQLENVILMLWPTINPDGQQMVAEWETTKGTDFGGLYQDYVGHDNNRDAYMLNMIESRVMEHTWRQWEPQIIYVFHQGAPAPSRIWFPPFAEPIATWAPPLMSREVNELGMAMARAEDEAAQRRAPRTWATGTTRALRGTSTTTRSSRTSRRTGPRPPGRASFRRAGEVDASATASLSRGTARSSFHAGHAAGHAAGRSGRKARGSSRLWPGQSRRGAPVPPALGLAAALVPLAAVVGAAAAHQSGRRVSMRAHGRPARPGAFAMPSSIWKTASLAVVEFASKATGIGPLRSLHGRPRSDRARPEESAIRVFHHPGPARSGCGRGVTAAARLFGRARLAVDEADRGSQRRDRRGQCADVSSRHLGDSHRSGVHRPCARGTGHPEVSRDPRGRPDRSARSTVRCRRLDVAADDGGQRHDGRDAAHCRHSLEDDAARAHARREGEADALQPRGLRRLRRRAL